VDYSEWQCYTQILAWIVTA